MLESIASWAMIISLILALVLGLLTAVAPTLETFVLFLVAIFGIIVGYFNVTTAESMKALMWSIGFGIIGIGFMASIPYIGGFLAGFVKTIGLFFSCAAGTFLFVLGIKIFGKR